jgi:hypothetical protein
LRSKDLARHGGQSCSQRDCNHRQTNILIGLLPIFPRQSQSEHRSLSRPSHIQATGLGRIGQVERLAMLATIYFSVRSPGLFYIAASLLHDVTSVGPALQMPAAELAFGVFLIAGALSLLFDFHFVMGELLRTRRGGSGLCCGQRSYPRRCGGGSAGVRSDLILPKRIHCRISTLNLPFPQKDTCRF